VNWLIRVICLSDSKEEQVSPEKLPNLDLSNTWLELVDPSPQELQAVSAATQIPAEFLKLPKTRNVIDLRLEIGVNIITFVAFQDILKAKDACPVVIAFSKDFLVTVVPKEVQKVIDNAKARMSKTRIDPPSVVAYFIVDEIVAEHFVLLEHLDDITAQIEADVANGASEKTLKRIFNIKTKMVKLTKVLWYERGVISNLKRCSDTACMSTKARTLFETSHEELTRQIDIVETYREILSDAINVYMSSTSNKINSSIKNMTLVMYYLTLITLVTSFPNTIATFFGITQFGSTNSYVIFAAIVLSVVLPVVWLWRSKWLSAKRLD
jgi:Mg2+ and Co2+ transporter CorA